MDDAVLVRGLERFSHLLRKRERVVDRNRTAGNALREIFSVDPLHDERVDVPGPERRVDESVDVRDVGMAECGERLRLTGEAREAIGIEREELGEDLDRNVTVQRAVVRTIDLPHAPCRFHFLVAIYRDFRHRNFQNGKFKMRLLRGDPQERQFVGA